MHTLVWKLLRHHLSFSQLTGFFLANLVGMSIVLLSIQCYRDVVPAWTQGDCFLQNEYIVATKKVKTLGLLQSRKPTFSDEERKELAAQPFIRSLGVFTPSLFQVSAGLNIPQAGIHFATYLFFESVPDRFVDIDLDQWKWDEETRIIPIVLPRNYLNLYNFGFAQSQQLPQISEGLSKLVKLDIRLCHQGKNETYQGQIVGFSNRLNTILVPQAFLEQANARLAPQQTAEPSRLILEVDNPADPNLVSYFNQQGYETENGQLNTSKTLYFLRLAVGIVAAVGLFISALSFYLLLLSLYLLLQKNADKLRNLLLIGYTPAEVARPYQLLTVALNGCTLVMALLLVAGIRSCYLPVLQTVFPTLETGSMGLTIGIGTLLFVGLSLLNGRNIQQKMNSLWKNNPLA